MRRISRFQKPKASLIMNCLDSSVSSEDNRSDADASRNESSRAIVERRRSSARSDNLSRSSRSSLQCKEFKREKLLTLKSQLRKLDLICCVIGMAGMVLSPIEVKDIFSFSIKA